MSKKWPIVCLLCLLLCSCAAEPPAQTEVPQTTEAPAEAEPEETAEAAPEETEEPAEQPEAEAPEEVPAETDAEESTAPAEPEAQADSGEQEAEAPETTVPAETETVPPQEPETTVPTAPPVPPDTVAPGLWETADGLYYVQEDRTCLVNGTAGYLTFGADGRYTSGDATLDAGIDALVASVCPDVTADREARLRLLYDHIRDNYRYLSMDHYEAGSTDWGNSAAQIMLEQGKGNCYNFAALFTACARRLGYQAYNVAGHEYSATNDHAWTMIEWPDGVTYLFDVQLEYAYQYMYSNRRDIDMFRVSGDGTYYNSFVYYFP